MLMTMTVTRAQVGSVKKGRLAPSAMTPSSRSSTLTAPSGWSIVRMISSETNIGTAQGSTKQKRQNPLALVSLRLMTMARIMPAM